MAEIEMTCGCGQAGMVDLDAAGNPPERYLCDGCYRRVSGQQPVRKRDVPPPRRLFGRRR